MICLAIDPGPVRSAWLSYDMDARTVGSFGIDENHHLLWKLRGPLQTSILVGFVVIEMVESYGMRYVGAETFETAVWVGRFTEAASPLVVDRLVRSTIKLHLLGNRRGKDSDIRQAIIDRFGGATAIGRKAEPGPLFGVSKDVWQALAVAVTYGDGVRWDRAA